MSVCTRDIETLVIVTCDGRPFKEIRRQKFGEKDAFDIKDLSVKGVWLLWVFYISSGAKEEVQEM